MKSLVFAGIATASLAFAASSVVASDSFTSTGKNAISSAIGAKANGVEAGPSPIPPMMGGNHGPRPGMPHMMGGNNGPRPGMPPMMGGGNHGPKMGMPHMMGGNNGPRPGFHGIPRNDVYRRPFRNFNLPSYWVQPNFYLNDYRVYGLRAPQNGSDARHQFFGFERFW